MGGYDVYCAICGGPLANVVSDEEVVLDVPDDEEAEETYDRNLVTPAMAEWLNHTRVMGENAGSESMNK